MVSGRRYLPILKARLGEFGAVANMSADERRHVSPLFEVPPIPWDHQNHVPAKTIDGHLKNLGKHIESAWGVDRPCFVDLGLLREAERMANGSHPVKAIFKEFRHRKLKVIPVTGLIRDEDHQTACLEALATAHMGVCFRVQPEDFRDEQKFKHSLAGLLQRFGLADREADLILDLGPLNENEGRDTSRALRFLQAIPNLESWRTLAVVAAGFPVNLMGFPQSTISAIRREEWDLWQGLIRDPRVNRMLVFGDYGIAHPEHTEVDPRKMTTSACIRYTSDDSWVIYRGRGLRRYGFQQFHDVARTLVGHASYRGPEFSWGDNYIADCARRQVGCGNLMTWRKVGTSHHIAFVNQQLASSSFSSVGHERSVAIPVGGS
jgi:Beta protein